VLALVSASPASASAPSSGFNVAGCQPSAAHPDPVVLLHGLGSSGAQNFSLIGPYLAGAGYCAFSIDYGANNAFSPNGFAPIAQSAAQIAAFVAQVKANTGAAKVDLVGHSEGAFQSLYVPKFEGNAASIGKVVALAPPTHGTTVAGIVTLGQLLGFGTNTVVNWFTNGATCYACTDLVTGGPAVSALESGPIAQPGIAYTIIASRYDEVVTPSSTAFVNEAGVHNAYVQDTCPFDPVGHVGIAVDTTIEQLITNALSPATARPVSCGFGPPF
jgi:triacylglycerol esterase/lipase EstA (alpha/beta hydrolase family)